MEIYEHGDGAASPVCFDLSLGLDDEPAPRELSGDAGERGQIAGREDAETPAREKIKALLDEMRPQRSLLVKIMDHCQTITAVSQVDAFVADLQSTNRSVFGPEELCGFLREAGALELVCEDGSPFGAVAAPVPCGGEDGELLEVAEPPVAHWHTTGAGKEVLLENNPLGEIEALFEAEATYLPIYKCIIGLCMREGGAKTPFIGAAVNGHELLQRPRLFATFFIDRLERAGAIEWKGAWVATDAGVASLDMLVGVEDVEVPDGDGEEAPAEPDVYDCPALE